MGPLQPSLDRAVPVRLGAGDRFPAASGRVLWLRSGLGSTAWRRIGDRRGCRRPSLRWEGRLKRRAVLAAQLRTGGACPASAGTAPRRSRRGAHHGHPRIGSGSDVIRTVGEYRTRWATVDDRPYPAAGRSGDLHGHRGNRLGHRPGAAACAARGRAAVSPSVDCGLDPGVVPERGRGAGAGHRGGASPGARRDGSAWWPPTMP